LEKGQKIRGIKGSLEMTESLLQRGTEEEKGVMMGKGSKA